jgi:hypothetical protein
MGARWGWEEAKIRTHSAKNPDIQVLAANGALKRTKSSVVRAWFLISGDL